MLIRKGLTRIKKKWTFTLLVQTPPPEKCETYKYFFFKHELTNIWPYKATKVGYFNTEISKNFPTYSVGHTPSPPKQKNILFFADLHELEQVKKIVKMTKKFSIPYPPPSSVKFHPFFSIV